MIYEFSVPGETSKIRFVCLIPKTIEDRQTIFDISYSVSPSRIYDTQGNRYAEFVFLNPKEDFQVRTSVKAQLIRYDLITAYANPRRSDEAIPAKYLTAEKYLEKDDPAVLEVSKKITGYTEIEMIRNIYYYVFQNMDHTQYLEEDLGATQAVKSGKGDCTEYADLFVALCRAKGIPARVAEDYYCIEGVDTPRQLWAEVYAKGYGWIPFDPLLGEVSPAAFDRLRPIYIYLSNVRNDKEINNYHYYAYQWSGDAVKMRDSLLIKSSETSRE